MPWLLKGLVGSLFSAFIFSILAYYVLKFGHPHEDAYILFIYSEQLANNGRITCFNGGPLTEGATDFLWMVLISGINRIGINSCLASLLLNLLGVFITTYIVLKICERFKAPNLVKIFFILLSPIYMTSLASFAGFSTSLYCALIALIFVTSVFADGKKLLFVPILGLILALFRPDGAIIGVTTTMLTILFIKKLPLKNYILCILICSLIGITYFIWRWSYFGHFLPYR